MQLGWLLPIANVLGRLLMGFSLAFVPPIAAAVVFDDGIAFDFFAAMLATFATGAVMLAAGWRHARELRPRDGFLLVTLSWMLFAGFASIPLVTGYGDIGFTKAYFEMVSAMTTTGATALVGLDNAPHSINLWRHLLQ